MFWPHTREFTVHDFWFIHVRDPFPVAAFGAYARELGLVAPDATLTLHQGHDVGRPSLLEVELRRGEEHIRVSGTAIRI